jgi:hypothetical protein
MSRVISIAMTLFTFFLTKKFTIGLRTIAIIVENIIGTIIAFAIDSIVTNANNPTIIKDAFA